MFACNDIAFTIFYFSEAATGGFLLEKVFLKISQYSQENTCGKDFLIKLQSEATASNLSRVFSWRFFVYFISTEKWDKKGKYSMEFKYLLFLLEYHRFVWRQRY